MTSLALIRPCCCTHIVVLLFAVKSQVPEPLKQNPTFSVKIPVRSGRDIFKCSGRRQDFTSHPRRSLSDEMLYNCVANFIPMETQSALQIYEEKKLRQGLDQRKSS